MNPRRIKLTIPCDPNNVALAGMAINRICCNTSLSDAEAFQTELSVVEALNNVIEHGYGGKSDEEVSVTVSLDADRVRFDIADGGKPLIIRNRPTLNFDSEDLESLPEGGMGRFIIHSCMDQVSYRRETESNHLTLVKLFGKKTKNND